jgi:hypothetical protein
MEKGKEINLLQQFLFSTSYLLEGRSCSQLSMFLYRLFSQPSATEVRL